MSDADDFGGPEARLEEVVKHLCLAREDVGHPAQDAALSRAQYLADGVLQELERDDDGVDPHLLTDGGREWRPVDDITKECPECSSLDLEVATVGGRETHRCGTCGAQFNRPALRQCPKGFSDYPVVKNRRPMTDGGEDLTIDPADFAAVVSVGYTSPAADYGGGATERGLSADEAEKLASVLLRGFEHVEVEGSLERGINDLIRTLHRACALAMLEGEADVATDGGSKYVNPTGDGYCGVGRVSGGSVGFGVGMFPVEWTGDTTVYAVDESPGVALVEDEPDEYLGKYQVSKTWGGGPGASVSIGGPALKPLGVSHGDDVRVYERDAGGLLLVPADGDPFVDGGDGA